MTVRPQCHRHYLRRWDRRHLKKLAYALPLNWRGRQFEVCAAARGEQCISRSAYGTKGNVAKPNDVLVVEGHCRKYHHLAVGFCERLQRTLRGGIGVACSAQPRVS